jgi:beta-mannanase
VAAWKHVREIFSAQHVKNVSWVWCPTIAGFANGTAPSFYPGDSMVDWTCVDVYSSAKLVPISQLLQPFLTWAAAHPKPIVIGEFGVSGAYGGRSRAAWLTSAAIEVRDNPQIKAVCYFDSDPDGAPATLSFSLPPGSTELAAFTAMARTPYFNPRHLRTVS